MTPVTKILALTIAAALLALAPLSAARASGRHHHAGHLALGLTALALLGTSHALAAGQHRGPVYYAPPPRRARYGRQRQRHSYGPCHTVYKRIYDAYGYPLKIAGTMCYDAYGRSYVVRGSRYVVDRY